MKKAILLAMLMTLAGKGHGATDLIDTAQVISSTAIIERVNEPRQECTPAAAPAPQQCRTVNATREYVKGYTVVYRYNGRDIKTTLPYEPGPTVRVGIGVIDSAPAGKAPTAGMMGSNVRDVSRPAPPPASDAAPAPAGSGGGYQYRY